MSYVSAVLQPGENVRIVGKLHWITYASAAIFSAAALVASIIAIRVDGHGRIIFQLGTVVLGAMAIMAFVRAWFVQWTTELAVTDRRVIYKNGFIRRHTAEMSQGHVETVRVDQSVLGRLLDFGTIHVRGSGQGIECLHNIASPLALRSAITAA